MSEIMEILDKLKMSWNWFDKLQLLWGVPSSFWEDWVFCQTFTHCLPLSNGKMKQKVWIVLSVLPREELQLSPCISSFLWPPAAISRVVLLVRDFCSLPHSIIGSLSCQLSTGDIKELLMLAKKWCGFVQRAWTHSPENPCLVLALAQSSLGD